MLTLQLQKCAAAIAAAIATARVCAAALSLQPSDEFVVKRDDVNALVDDRAVPYTHGSATKREALQRLLSMQLRVCDAHHQRCLGVAAQRLLQQPRELGVSKRHVAAICGPCADAHAQRGQALVDGDRLGRAHANRPALLQPLTAGQVDQVELANLDLVRHHAFLLRQLYRLLLRVCQQASAFDDREQHDCVAAAGVGIQMCERKDAIAVAQLQVVQALSER
mmetsp:Transcript_31943/g.95398  ORF Transcript_31943/g.95398 Transcript_31943/m.95398 type:complete len:222 (-) Transcript_31943:1226-1891(-)